MVKTLQKYGNSHALIIDKALMDAMGIGPETPLTVSMNGDTMTVRPSDVGVGRERLAPIIERLRTEYGDALKRLAE